MDFKCNSSLAFYALLLLAGLSHLPSSRSSLLGPNNRPLPPLSNLDPCNNNPRHSFRPPHPRQLPNPLHQRIPDQPC
ncbi:hypothetical protein BDV10DRAFT_162526 [Aspergillus recurvatus]